MTNIKYATKDYLPAVQQTQASLRVKHGLDTELVPDSDDKLMQLKYALTRNVDENRIKIQIVREHNGISTSDGRTSHQTGAGVTTFEDCTRFSTVTRMMDPRTLTPDGDPDECTSRFAVQSFP